MPGPLSLPKPVPVRMPFPLSRLFLALVLLTACGAPPRPVAPPAPRTAGVHPSAAADVVAPPDVGKRVAVRNGVVSSADPRASEAGVEILRAGGNAIDAAVATAFAIGVVEPHMSGLGGSGSALVWIAEEGRPYYLDFYAAQNADSFRGRTGGPRPPGDLRIVGIPGNVAGLLDLHERWGKLPLEQVMAPAIRLAEEGFAIGSILAEMIAREEQKLKRFPEAAARYWPEGRPLQPGTIFRNPELAATLRRIAEHGRAGFYEGPVAEAVVAMMNAGGHPVTLADLAAYPTRWMRPLCTDYRGYTVLSGPPPQTGIQVLHTLELLEPFDLPALGLPTRSAAAFDVLASALRVGTTARTGNADPDWVRIPANGIVSEAFARSRAGLVGTGRAVPTVERADATPFDDAPPPAACAPLEPYGPAQPIRAAVDAVQSVAPDEGGETTHLSVVDAEGNAVSLTQTNSTLFGSGAWVAGFFLNDSGYRFGEEELDAPARRRWRTRTSTIAPTIVLDDEGVRMVVGAPGSGRIPTAIVQTIVYTLDYGMDPLAAVRMPRIFPTPGEPRVEFEHGFAPDVLGEVRAMGYDPVASGFGYARMYLVARQGDGWVGVADPRHDGEPRGF